MPTLTSREFNRNVGRAKRAAADRLEFATEEEIARIAGKYSASG
jgi:hypothetical protein